MVQQVTQAQGKGMSQGGTRRSSSLGKLRNSITNAAQEVAKSGVNAAAVRRPSLTNKLAAGGVGKTPLALGPPSEDTKWRVGGRYQVSAGGANVWPSADANGEPMGELKAKDYILLVNIMEPEGALRSRGPPMGLIIPPTQEIPPGWIVLEDVSGGNGALVRRRLEGSWEMHARYTVMSAATIRKGKALSTDCVGELEANEEVLALELDFNEGDHGAKPRLRMQVSSERGLVGWISPETSSGYQLLNPVNLLSNKVVEIHRRSLSAGRGRLSLIGNRASTLQGDAGAVGRAGSDEGQASPGGKNGVRGPRASYAEGGLLPWQVGGQYRALEKLVARDKPALNSKEIGKISAGSLITFSEVEFGEGTAQASAWVPCALVVVDDGPEQGRKGWIRCAANDGHDLVDTRDQLESQKVKLKLEQQEIAARAAEQQKAEEEAARKREEAKRLKEQKAAEEKARKAAEKRQAREAAAAAAKEEEMRKEEEEKRIKQTKTPSCGACFAGIRSGGVPGRTPIGSPVKKQQEETEKAPLVAAAARPTPVAAAEAEEAEESSEESEEESEKNHKNQKKSDDL